MLIFRIYIIIACFWSLPNELSGQANFKIITRDVENFWEAFDSLQHHKDTVKIFQNLVIDRASDEFRVFIRKWNIKARDYAKQVRDLPKFYRSLREHSYKLIDSQDSIRKTVSRFQRLYPNFNPADICIAFGNFNTGGNIDIENNNNLVYIGLEYHGVDDNTHIDELSISTRDYVSRSNFFRTIIHELVHVQQKTHGKKIAGTFRGNLLVHRILSEGLADFVGKLIVDNGRNGNYYDYGLQNEKDLKIKLKNEVWNTGSGNWFGGNDSLFVNMPRDLGYFMGSRIGQSFYDVNNLQNSDLTSLIEIGNAEKFIKKSKYFDSLQ